MKKECAHTRKMLPKYLRGHLFKLEQVRIEKHLRSCVVCYSQYQTLKRTDETRRYLKDITPPEGVVQIVKEGVTGLGRIKLLLYRPLWIVAIVAAAAVLFYFLSKPRQLDVEIDRIVTHPSPSTAQVSSRPPAPAAPPPNVRPAPVVAPPAIPVEPLSVSIAIDDDKASLRRLNGIMAGHGQLRKYKFTNTVREISGSLTPKELRTFFNRIAPIGTVTYNHKRFKSFPSALPLPFVIKLTIVPRPPEEKTPAQEPAKNPGEPTGSSSTPPRPAETAPPSSGPTPSTAH